MTFTEVFGGTTIYPSGVSYRAVALSADQTLSWPVETATSGNVVAQIMDVTPSAGSLSIIMPPANEVSVGETTLFFNPGGFTFTVKDNGGNTIVAIAPGLSYQVYLIGNATVNGTWRSTQYAAGTSSATAGSLVGAGIKAINTTLNQSMSVTTLNSNYSIGDADRSEAFVWTGGAGALTLPASGTVGNDWFCHIRNGGTGAITLTPTGSELINGAPNLTFNPGDSAIVICDGASFFTIGFGQSVAFAFDYVSIDLSSPVTSPYTLSGANLNRIAYSFGGTLTANMQVLIPATIQQYWISNDTSGAFSLTVKVAGQVGVVIPQGSRGIYYCNGTDIIDADTASFAFPLTVAQGGTGATTESGARINLGGTSVGIGVFTAVTAADGRNALSAAKSGVNSDITSLTGLTTPLSVPQGGTGAATLAANGVLLGNGTSAIQATAVGATGQVLVGNTGAAPSWAALSGIGVTSLSFGSTGLTPATATTGAITVAGTLGVANGGTGTAAAFTAGSVVFAGASGVYTQDNANFFWDDTNNRLGIGTATPAAKLSVAGNQINTVADEIYAVALKSTSGSLKLSPYRAAHGGSILISFNADESVYAPFTASAAYIRLQTDGTERMRITTAGDVGIGTSAPDVTLHVQSSTGQARVQNTTSGTALIGFRNSTTTDVPWVGTGGDDIRITTQSAERMRILSGGNVGISTSTPTAMLSVNGTTKVGEGVATNTSKLMVNTLSGVAAGIQLIQDANESWIIQNPASTNVLTFGNSGTERMRITAAGNVGIGTTSPESPFQVLARFRVQSDGIVRWGSSVASASYNESGYLTWNTGRVTVGYEGTGAVTFETTGAESMRIDSAGNVGIGTSSPVYKLVVSNAGAAGIELDPATGIIQTYNRTTAAYTNLSTYGLQQRFFTGSSPIERMRIDNTGPVLIGLTTAYQTAANATNLQIGDPLTTAGAGISLGATTTNDIAFADNTTGTGQYAGLIRYSHTSDFMALWTASTEQMRITSAGDVGIGTSSPTARLHVNSGASTTAAIIESTGTSSFVGLRNSGSTAYVGSDSTGALLIQTPGSAFSTKVFVGSTGNVGIGTSSPGAKLDVVGNGIYTVADDAYATAFNATTGNLRIVPYLGAYSGSALLAYSAGYAGFGPLSLDALRLQLFTGGTERMRIDSAGDVGIGTTAPEKLLSVSNAGANGFEIEPREGNFSRLISYNRSTAAYTPVLLEGLDLRFFTGSGSERMRINTSGYVGIGTSNPLSQLVVSNGSNENMEFTSGSVSLNGGVIEYINRGAFPTTRPDLNYYIGVPGAHKFYTDTFERMRIDSTGFVGIGTSTPVSRLHVNSASSDITYTTIGNNNGGTQIGVDTGGISVLSSYSSTAIRFGNSSSTTFVETMRLTDNGALLVGSTNTSDTTGTGIKIGPNFDGTGVPRLALVTSASIGTTSSLSIYSTGAAAFRFYVDNAGNIYAANTSITAISDIRLKENVRELDAGLDKILALKPRRFDWKQGKGKDVRDDMGFIAQEVEEVLPELVSGWKAGEGEPDDLKSVKAGDLIPVLVKAIQELTARVAQLEERK
jgi:hypothetical protein